MNIGFLMLQALLTAILCSDSKPSTPATPNPTETKDSGNTGSTASLDAPLDANTRGALATSR